MCKAYDKDLLVTNRDQPNSRYHQQIDKGQMNAEY